MPIFLLQGPALANLIMSFGRLMQLVHAALVVVQVKAFNGKESLEAALEGADLVVIPAGVPRKPGMTRDDLFNTNASIVKGLVEAAAKVCPKVCHSLQCYPTVVESTDVKPQSEYILGYSSVRSLKCQGILMVEFQKSGQLNHCSFQWSF